ncbi:RICIN domain-containing protein [Halocatena halophila]|uniref:RICIN domain-containing protein n=1 Tax=Halocatena halophila TaxID=2814576 RepID=UPI002ED0ED28
MEKEMVASGDRLITRRTALRSMAGIASAGIGALSLSDRATAKSVGEYVILHWSGRVLDYNGTEPTADANLTLGERYSPSSQRWIIDQDSGENYYIKLPGTDLVLDLSQWRGDDDIYLERLDNFPSQRWQFEEHSAGGYYIVNERSDAVLDVDKGLMDKGTTVVQQEMVVVDSQRWAFLPF